jgi:ribose transport system substrate-binding protein
VKLKKIFAVASASLLALTLAACSPETAVEEPADDIAEAIAEVQNVDKIAFFGFWSTNSFTLAVLQGVENAAAEIGAEVVDLSPAAYDGVAQIAAMQDQTTRGDAQVYVVLGIDNIGLEAATREAIDAGITVVAAFTPLGSDFGSLEPSVDGLIVVGETPVSNGAVLAELAIAACADLDPCNVAYLEGFAVLPLDNARTQSFKDTLAAGAPQAVLVAQVEGGYDPATGQAAAQDALQAANGDIDVMVGSSQAILGAMSEVDTATVKLIGNGSSIEAFEAVRDGRWFALYNLDTVGMGAMSVKLGVEKANGGSPNPVFDVQTLLDPRGTVDVIAGLEPAYSDLG